MLLFAWPIGVEFENWKSHKNGDEYDIEQEHDERGHVPDEAKVWIGMNDKQARALHSLILILYSLNQGSARQFFLNNFL